MKNWFVAFLAALWLLPSEAASVTKKIGVQDFTGVVAGGIYDVTLIRADVCSVEVTCEADMADDLRIAVKKGVSCWRSISRAGLPPNARNFPTFARRRSFGFPC